MPDSRLANLLDSSIYPDLTASVRHIQTHISHLFITDSFVYKIKKPVDFGFLDFTSLEKRRYYCNEELRLNRRLSPDVYLEVLELFEDENGAITFFPKGEVVEYAVKMVRLPEERMMSTLLDKGMVSSEEIEKLASLVARFHLSAATDDRISSFGSAAIIRKNWLQNLQQTLKYTGRTLSLDDHQLISRLAMEFIDSAIEVIKQRVEGGFIRDCDGDLHSENICLDEKIHIFDCIEFSEDFRFSDTAADVAFLAMDLENHGCLDLARIFVARYIQITGDSGIWGVLPLYLANRAFIRGKVSSLCIDDKGIDESAREAAATRAARYFRLSKGYFIRQKLEKTLFITSGPTGCGKSTLAAELCFQLGIRQISSDVERKRMAGVRETDRSAAIYGEDWNKATYDRLAEVAATELSQGRSVVVDATFRSVSLRERFGRLAASSGAAFVIIMPLCSEDVAKSHIAEREKSGISTSDGNWAVYQSQISTYEPPAPQEGRVLQIDVDDTLKMTDRLLKEIGLL